MITLKRLNNAIDKLEFDATLILAPEEILEVLKTARQSILNAALESSEKALKANECLERAGVITPLERHESDVRHEMDMAFIRNSSAAQLASLLYPVGAYVPKQLAERFGNLAWKECDGLDGRPDVPGYWVRTS